MVGGWLRGERGGGCGAALAAAWESFLCCRGSFSGLHVVLDRLARLNEGRVALLGVSRRGRNALRCSLFVRVGALSMSLSGLSVCSKTRAVASLVGGAGGGIEWRHRRYAREGGGTEHDMRETTGESINFDAWRFLRQGVFT